MFQKIVDAKARAKGVPSIQCKMFQFIKMLEQEQERHAKSDCGKDKVAVGYQGI